MWGSVLVRGSGHAVVLAIVAAVAPGAAVVPASPVPVVTIAFQTNPAAGAARYLCIAKADNPHWSRKDHGETVLIKTRVTCTGPGPAQFRVLGTLASSPTEGGPYRNRASSDVAQEVNNDGRETTSYTPQQGEPSVRGSAWYRATITATVVGPVSQRPLGGHIE